ncbi:MAG: PAS domain-containing protein [Fuerstiella sp.]
MRNLEKETLLFLYSLGLETRSLLDPRRIMARVTRSLGRHLKCSRCAYADVEADTDSFTIFEDYTDGCESSAGKYSLKLFGPQAEQQMHRGQTLVINDVTRDVIDADGAAMFASIGIKAIICCPLVKSGQLKAMMAVHQTEPRDWRAAEISLVEEVVDRCWATIERAKAQQTAERAARQFEALFDYSPDALILLNSTGRITLVNEQAACLFQVPKQKMVGRQGRSLFADISLPQLLSSTRASESEDTEPGQCSRHVDIVRADGERVTVEAHSFSIELTGESLEVLNLRDISERLKLERELTQANRMETLGRLVGGVAHDFNNLMTAVVNTTAALQMPDSRLEMSDGLQIIADAGLRAGKLTRQLLAFSRQQVMKPVPIRINELVTELAPLLRQSMKPKDRLRLQLCDGQPTILADENQLLQVLLNLTVNASDAMPNAGVLTIRSSSDPEQITLEFIDTGTGIRREDLGHIFEPFYTTKAADKGTGLGLATVYGIVKQSGGEISVTSQLNRGTNVRLTFPLVDVASIAEPESLSGPLLKRVVLLVEDDESIRHTTARLLRKHGLTVHPAGSGEDGLLQLLELDGNVDCIISDVVMPGMSGAVLAKRIHEGFPDLPILFVSGFPADQIGDDGVLQADEHFLAKPYSESELLDALRRALAAPPKQLSEESTSG